MLGGLSWFYNSPLLGVVTGVLLGTGLALLTQSRTQKRAWRRELGLKNIDTIYGPLYNELGLMLRKVRGFNATDGYSSIDNSQWQRIRGEYVYDIILSELKTQLDDLYGLVDTFNRSIMPMNVEAERQVLLAASKLYGTDTWRVNDIRYYFSPYLGAAAPLGLYIPAIFGQHPRDILRSQYPDVKKPIFYVGVTFSMREGRSRAALVAGVASATNDAPKNEFREATELAKFDEFYNELSKTIQSTPLVVTVRKAVHEIEPLAGQVRDSILGLIKQPLSI